MEPSQGKFALIEKKLKLEQLAWNRVETQPLGGFGATVLTMISFFSSLIWPEWLLISV